MCDAADKARQELEEAAERLQAKQDEAVSLLAETLPEHLGAADAAAFTAGQPMTVTDEAYNALSPEAQV